MTAYSLAPACRHQRGATLIVAMILLMIMSLLAAASLRGTLMQERMSSNTYDRDLAFQTAEAGLRMGEWQAENWVKNGATTPWPSCTTANAQGLYKTDPQLCPEPLWKKPDPGSDGTFWHDATGDAGDIKFDASGLSLAPYYIVELIAENAPCQMDKPDTGKHCKRFRVTSRSRTSDGRSNVVLQSIYATE
ncbi:MAG: pilus assembly protein [Azoarcus sp.]|jgi:type IV pilus assembly protein PilX|nr:pilus assembly protein [Azoarcus sp.]